MSRRRRGGQRSRQRRSVQRALARARVKILTPTEYAQDEEAATLPPPLRVPDPRAYRPSAPLPIARDRRGPSNMQLGPWTGARSQVTGMTPAGTVPAAPRGPKVYPVRALPSGGGIGPAYRMRKEEQNSPREARGPSRKATAPDAFRDADNI